MSKGPKNDSYWPLAGLSYAQEVHDFFPQEAELLGVIAILWSRQELALKRLFVDLIDAQTPAYAEAIWNRLPTHQSRRDLLALALDTCTLSSHQQGVLTWVIDKSKTVADRRNELMHAEYVVHGRTSQLHARIKSPRSTKPAKHQKASVKDLRQFVEDMELLLQATEGAWFELLSEAKRAEMDALIAAIREAQPSKPEA